MEIVELFKNLLLSSGTAWILWMLLGLSVASVAIAVERWLVLRSSGCDVRALRERLDGPLGRGDAAGALRVLDEDGSVPSRIAATGLRLVGHGPAAVQHGMEATAAAERSVLERRLAFLGTLGNNAPFIGLFGTVIGVILAFEALGQSTDGLGADAAGQSSALVMSAIAEALVATAVGIGVALPAVAAFNYFQRRIGQLMSDAEALAKYVLAYLHSESLRFDGAPREEKKEVA